MNSELTTANGEIDLLTVCLEDITSRLEHLCQKLTTRFQGQFIAFVVGNKPSLCQLANVYLVNGQVRVDGYECSKAGGQWKVTKRRRAFNFQQVTAIHTSYDNIK